jgi:hypothetical protein
MERRACCNLDEEEIDGLSTKEEIVWLHSPKRSPESRMFVLIFEVQSNCQKKIFNYFNSFWDII